MNITRNVVTDLLPIYLSGEASADTRALVEEYLGEHVEFSRLVAETREEARSRLFKPALALSDSQEAALVARTRSEIRRAIWIRAGALSCLASLLVAAGAWTFLRHPSPQVATVVGVANDVGQVALAVLLIGLVVQFYRRRAG
jgi:predicted anti-sigma-YlaC factor YlaD